MLDDCCGCDLSAGSRTCFCSQGFGFDAQATLAPPPQQTTPTLKIKLGPSPKASPMLFPTDRAQPAPQQPEHHLPPQPAHQPQLPQQPAQAVKPEAQQPQQQLLQQPKPKKAKLARTTAPQEQQLPWQYESQQQLQEQASQEPRPKKRKQGRGEGEQGHQAQLAPKSEGQQPIRLKLSGSLKVTPCQSNCPCQPLPLVNLCSCQQEALCKPDKVALSANVCQHRLWTM